MNEDKDRLDYLEQCVHNIGVNRVRPGRETLEQDLVELFTLPSSHVTGRTLREAIDNAIERARRIGG